MTSTTTARLAAIGTRMAAVAAAIAPIIERMDARDPEIAALAAGIRARDWTIGETPRPAGGTYDGSVNETRAKREAMCAQRAELEALQASDRAACSALSSERTALVNEHGALELEVAEAGEPADLTDDIELASSALADLQAKRATRETAIADALAREADAQADIDAEAAAIKVLEAARADNYLKPSDTNAGSADDAEMAASDARHKAAGARAALPRLAAKTQQARDKLVAQDEAIEAAQDELAGLHERQRQGQAHAARNAVRRAMADLGGAVADLLDADPDGGARLLRVLDDGLVTYGPDSRTTRPRWLSVVGRVLPQRQAAAIRAEIDKG